MERNKLTYDEAEKRWKAGIDNYSVVQNADVIFATQWKYDFTQVQVSQIRFLFCFLFCSVYVKNI